LPQRSQCLKTAAAAQRHAHPTRVRPKPPPACRNTACARVAVPVACPVGRWPAVYEPYPQCIAVLMGHAQRSGSSRWVKPSISRLATFPGSGPFSQPSIGPNSHSSGLFSPPEPRYLRYPAVSRQIVPTTPASRPPTTAASGVIGRWLGGRARPAGQLTFAASGRGLGRGASQRLHCAGDSAAGQACHQPDNDAEHLMGDHGAVHVLEQEPTEAADTAARPLPSSSARSSRRQRARQRPVHI